MGLGLVFLLGLAVEAVLESFALPMSVSFAFSDLMIGVGLSVFIGLVSGIILQIGYNYCVSKIDRMISEMEESSITLIDSIVLLAEGKPLIQPSATTDAADEE